MHLNFPTLLLLATLASPIGDSCEAQTLSDSVAIARLVIPRALADSRRQSAVTKKIVVATDKPGLNQWGEDYATGARLLRLAADSSAVVQKNPPVCPWFGGDPELALEVSMDRPVFTGADAKVSVMLGCREATAVLREGNFGWVFTYRFRKTANRWHLVATKEEFIS